MHFLFFHIEKIIAQYHAAVPLATFLRDYFKSQPKLGSRDRRSISEAVYVFYRCAKLFPEGTSYLDIVYQGMDLCGSKDVFLRKSFQKVGYQAQSEASWSPANWPLITAFQDRFSGNLEQGDWLSSLLRQPRLFLRIRNAQEEAKAKLEEASIIYYEEKTELSGDKDSFFAAEGTCLSLPNGSKIDGILPPKNLVVQDWASQAVMSSLTSIVKGGYHQESLSIWDVCAGAGGKAIYWMDRRKSDQLIVSDIRESILRNLKSRFHRYQLQLPTVLRLDARDKSELARKLDKKQFDVIICDVPCTGSGTWGRTPENFHFFKAEQLPTFANRQITISNNAFRFLKRGGLFAYITCSVFKDENEDVVAELLKNEGLALQYQTLVDGSSRQADSLFLAVLVKR